MWRMRFSHFHLPSHPHFIPTTSIHRSSLLFDRPKLPSSTHSSQYGSKANASSPTLQTQRQCHCPESETPNLDIDRVTPLKGTIPAHNTQVLISTGKCDWNEKIEFEEGLAADLKRVLGRGGLNKGFEELRDPHNVTLVTNSSYRPSTWPSNTRKRRYSSAYIFPQNLYVPVIPLSHSPTLPSAELAQFIRTYLHSSSSSASTLSASELPFKSQKVYETHVLICSHNSRDARCGIIGPILYKLFTENLEYRGLLHPENPDISLRGKVRVGNISHIGGHKFAGNVIVYMPPGKNWRDGGKGIWYGRVGGQADVERIVNETILQGRVIDELFRGGLGIKGIFRNVPIERTITP